MAKKQIPITLRLDDIMYDIRNKTYVVGRSKDTGENPEQVAGIQADDEPESLNQILRSIGTAFASVRMQLSKYIDTVQTSGDNAQFEGDSDLDLVLNLPDNFDETAIDVLSSSMHNYIVNTAIAGWFSLTNQEEMEKYVKLARSNNIQMMKALHTRKRPERP